MLRMSGHDDGVSAWTRPLGVGIPASALRSRRVRGGTGDTRCWASCVSPTLYCSVVALRSRLGATGQSDAVPNLELPARRVDLCADCPLFPCEKSNSILGTGFPRACIDKADCARP